MGSRLMHLITGETVASKPNIIRNKREFLTAASITLTGRIIDKINEYVNLCNYYAKEGNPLYE
jgi:hypothetical protein